LICFWCMPVVVYPQFKIVGYVPNWINLNTFANGFDYTKVTHLNIAFKNPDANGVLPIMSASEKNLLNKAHQAGVKVLISIAGATASNNVTIRDNYFQLISPAKRSDFAAALKKYLIEEELDGIDVDLEGPAINGDYGAFIQVLSDSLRPVGKLVTAALSDGYGGANVPSSTFSYFDWINIMAYDASGPTWGTPGQHSSYEFAEQSIAVWVNRGLPKAKAILGVPFYGYRFGGAVDYNSYTFAYIANNFPTNIYDDEAGNTIYYNGINTIVDKTYLARSDAGGIMIWELSQDATGNNSLLSHIHSASGLPTSVQTFSEGASSFGLYPNPTQGAFEVTSAIGYLYLEVINTLGETVKIFQAGESPDLTGFPAGVYNVRITADDKMEVRKIVVQE
jgi:chitinase